jgi:predicted P-loop ATPase
VTPLGSVTHLNRGWLNRCSKNRSGEPLPVVSNALLALRSAGAIKDCVAFDEMSRCPVLLHEVGQPLEPVYRPLRDSDVVALAEWMQLAGIRKMGVQMVHDAVGLYAREQSFNPVRDWLESLEWDCVPRLNVWLVTRLGAELSEYNQRIGEMFLISMVARIFEPGCKVDYMLVLEGAQGELKSSACAALAGEYFSDNLPDVTTKDASQYLRGKWLIEIAEMHAVSKADELALKAFLTRQVERYRPSHGRLEVTEPRHCCFIGSTNQTAYLRDETGGRRFWPVKTGAIDLPGLQADREQLFAEAVAQYQGGAPWWPDKAFERAHIKPVQEARFEVDIWEAPIASFLKDTEAAAAARGDIARVTLSQVAGGALKLEVGRVGTADQRRLSKVMVRLEWKPAKRTEAGRWWSKSGS